MNKKQSNKLNAYQYVKGVLEKNRKMDRLLLRLRADHPQFYDAYISARRIIDR